MNRLKKVSAALAVVVIAGGFMTLGSAAQAAPVTQDGPINYTAPARARPGHHGLH